MNTMVDAQAYGQRIAEMLKATDFSAEQKAAWASLVPGMTPEQLKRFDAILKLNMREQIEQEFEDALTAMRAAVDKHEIAVGALRVQHGHELDAIEQQVKSLEAAKKTA